MDKVMIGRYFWYSLDFFVKALVPVLLLSLPYRRRSRLLLRALVVPVFVALWSLAVTVIALAASGGSGLWFALVQYSLLLAGVYAVQLWLFACSPSVQLINLLGGYALCQVCLFVYSLLSLAFPVLEQIHLYFHGIALVQWIWFLLAYLLLYFLYLRRVDVLEDLVIREPTIYVCLVATALLLVFNIVRAREAVEGSLLNFLCILVLNVCNVLILSVRSNLVKKIRSRRELMLERKLWEDREQSLKLTAEAVNTINIKYHDLKHLSSMLRQGTESEAFLADMTDSLKQYETAVSTGNRSLDLALTEQVLKLSQNHVDFVCMADGSQLDFLQSVDIISLFSNALDNALEANLALPETERAVYLTVKGIAEMVSICVENPFANELTMENGLPVTKKEDRSLHGFGMQSIRATVEKYSGDLTVSTDNHWFKLQILIPRANPANPEEAPV